jgi:S-adenosylmethionine/arginine decarboxylase-like enzyme
MSVFGYSYILDMYDCALGICDDLEAHYRFLERLVEALGMDKMSAPFVIHAPRLGGIEQYPDKAGVSGWIPLIQSGISIHSIEPTHFATLDVYSCKWFEPEQVIAVAEPTFGYCHCEQRFIDRGTRYPTPR